VEGGELGTHGVRIPGLVGVPGFLRIRFAPDPSRRRSENAPWAELDQAHQHKHFDIHSLGPRQSKLPWRLGYSVSVFQGVGVPSGRYTSASCGWRFVYPSCGGIDLLACSVS
jgi:hypothetical protein